MLIPYIFKGSEEAARSMVGIYGANIKIAIVMVMFTQAFRYAYEPFIFAQAKNDGESRRLAYCDAMKFFLIFGLFIFLGVMFFLPILKHFISPSYWLPDSGCSRHDACRAVLRNLLQSPCGIS